MLTFLQSLFGADITLTNFTYTNDTPYIFVDRYIPQLMTWDGYDCVLLKPRAISERLPVLKKQFKIFQQICPIPCALCLEHLSAAQRRNLIENHIPFVAISQQVYLPFWGCYFQERFKKEVPIAEKMAPTTQLVCLYLYYSQRTAAINLTQIVQELSISKPSCTRAIDDLSRSGLITQREEGTNKWILPAYDKAEFLQKAYVRMKSPVRKTLYVKLGTQIENQMLSGVRALARKTLIGETARDGAVAITKESAGEIPVDAICSEQYFNDFGGSIIEVWSYNPRVLANENCVDDISLILSMDNNPNERVQLCLDEIRSKHQLPIKEE